LYSTDSENSAAIEELKKQITDIVQELSLLKEKQALQTGICPEIRKFVTNRKSIRISHNKIEYNSTSFH